MDNAKAKTSWVKRYAQRYFVDALGSMAKGLFATLLVGTIIWAVSTLVGMALPAAGTELNTWQKILSAVNGFLKTISGVAMNNYVVGAAIGIAIAHGMKVAPLAVFSAAVTGAIGYCSGIVGPEPNALKAAIGFVNSDVNIIAGPIGAYFAAVIGAELGNLVAGKTKVDILVVPLVSILTGGLIGYLLGAPLAFFIKWLSRVIGLSTALAPIPMGLIVAVLVGWILTAPISSAAICAMLFSQSVLDSQDEVVRRGLMLAAGAATVGCCCQMVGFAVASFRENKWGGLVSQGLGTSMLQVPNIVRHPAIIVPPTLAAAILGPIATTLLPMQNTGINAGMGTCGLVGQIGTYIAMLGLGESWWLITIKVLLLHIILPAAIAFGASELMRKLGWIKKGDMLLE